MRFSVCVLCRRASFVVFERAMSWLAILLDEERVGLE